MNSIPLTSTSSGTTASSQEELATSQKITESMIESTRNGQKDLLLLRLKNLHEFTCQMCKKSKKTKNVVVTHDDYNPSCNGCYGLLLSKNITAR